MLISDLISPDRIFHALPASSKKRLLEKLCLLIHQDEPSLDEQAAFNSLFEREKLGSTGIGGGVAIPHGRMKGLDKAIGAFATLESEMDYDSIDNKPVNMVFALLVPEDANEEHLQLLAQLATIFKENKFRDILLHARNNQEIYEHLSKQVGEK